MGAFFLTGIGTSVLGVACMYCGFWQREPDSAKLVLGTGFGMTVAGFMAAYVGGLFP